MNTINIKPRWRAAHGFTLIELMIVLAVIGILTAIAIPSYNAYILRSHRAEAKNFLLAVAQRLEQNYTLSGSYVRTQGSAVDNINNAWINTTGYSAVPPGGPVRYNITFAVIEAGRFTLQAVPAGAQVADAACGTLMLNNQNIRGAQGTLDNRSQPTRDCWGR